MINMFFIQNIHQNHKRKIRHKLGDFDTEDELIFEEKSEASQNF